MRTVNWDHGFCSLYPGILCLATGCEFLGSRCPQKAFTRIVTGCSPVRCAFDQSSSVFLCTRVRIYLNRNHDSVDSASPSYSTWSSNYVLAGGRFKRAASRLPHTLSWAAARRVHTQRSVATMSGYNSEGRCTSVVSGLAAVLLLQLWLHSASANAAQFEPLVAIKFLWEPKAQVEPAVGTCATCIGVVDETLGSCNAVANCVSSFDDRPIFFVAPWEFPGELGTAIRDLTGELRDSGATIKEEEGRYVHAIVSGDDGVLDDIEFLFSDPSSDATVCIRAASRAIDYDDHGRNRKMLDQLRKALRWDEVPILRNRVRKLFFIESPWDTFGPEPPPTFNYKDALDFAQE